MNVLWGGASVRAWRKFRHSLRSPGETQKRLLFRYLAANRDTVFGRTHGFSEIRSVEQFQEQVPVIGYDGLEPLVQEIARGKPRMLTEAPVERLVPTGGSTAATKLIPFTAPLRREFSLAIDAWLVDLFTRHPSLLAGPAYWSITPAAAFNAGISNPSLPIGFDDDSMYLGGVRQRLAQAIMAVPPAVGRLRGTGAFQYATVLFLLRARDLRLISVWHPSFLDGLFDLFEEHRDRLLHDLAAGTFNPPERCEPGDLVVLQRLLQPQPGRARTLRAAPSGDLRAVWPNLSLISCWADALSRGAAERIARRAGHVAVQAKGLLATEGVVTIPFAERHPLAIGSHFFEFVDASGTFRLAHELQLGGEYTVVLTTGGGLYRYRLGDCVKVDGCVGETPSLRFLGRDELVSDWFGEKLTDGFVAGVLRSLFWHPPSPRFAMLAPERTSSGMRYTLFLDADASRAPDLSARLEMALRRNPQYAWCVDLGQLRPARVVPVGPGASRAYLDACAARGQRIGDVKPVALRPDTGWENVLSAESVASEVGRC